MIFAVYLLCLSVGFLWLFFHVEGKKLLKFIAVVLFLHGYLTVYSTINELSGYPTRESMPEMTQVLWGIATMPNPSEDFSGYIDLWVLHEAAKEEEWLDWFSLAHKGQVSRVYRIPYTKKNHDELKMITSKIQKGKRIGLAIDKKSGTRLDLSEAQQKYGVVYESIKLKK